MAAPLKGLGATTVAFLVLGLGTGAALLGVEHQNGELQKQNRALAQEIEDRTQAFCEARAESFADINEILLKILGRFPQVPQVVTIKNLVLERELPPCP